MINSVKDLVGDELIVDIKGEEMEVTMKIHDAIPELNDPEEITMYFDLPSALVLFTILKEKLIAKLGHLDKELIPASGEV
jgi:hypothetical protein